MINAYELATLRRADALCGRYELVNPSRNQNKFWSIQPQSPGSTLYVRVWGRIGTRSPRRDASPLTATQLQELVMSKVDKGYRRVN